MVVTVDGVWGRPTPETQGLAKFLIDGLHMVRAGGWPTRVGGLTDPRRWELRTIMRTKTK